MAQSGVYGILLLTAFVFALAGFIYRCDLKKLLKG